MTISNPNLFYTIPTHQKINAVRFVPNDVIGMGVEVQLLSGSWDEEHENTLTLHSIRPSSTTSIPTIDPFHATPDLEGKTITSVNHPGDVTSIQFIDGIFVTTSGTGWVRWWKLDTEDMEPIITELSKLRAHFFNEQENASCVASAVQRHTRDKLMATAGTDGRLILLRADRNVPTAVGKVDSHELTDVCWVSSDQLITSSFGGAIKLYDTRDFTKPALYKFLHNRKVHEPITSITVNPSQTYKLAAGTYEGDVIFWDIRNLANPEWRKEELHVSKVPINDLLYHPTAETLFTASQEGILGVHDCISNENRKLQNLFSKGGLNSLDYHEGMGLVACGSDDMNVMVKYE